MLPIEDAPIFRYAESLVMSIVTVLLSVIDLINPLISNEE
jgi:hypothetical protein